MTSTCSHCSRPVLSRQHGAAKILAILRGVEDDPGETEGSEVIGVTMVVVNEVREVCESMICFCERSVAEVEAA